MRPEPSTLHVVTVEADGTEDPMPQCGTPGCPGIVGRGWPPGRLCWDCAVEAEMRDDVARWWGATAPSMRDDPNRGIHYAHPQVLYTYGPKPTGGPDLEWCPLDGEPPWPPFPPANVGGVGHQPHRILRVHLWLGGKWGSGWDLGYRGSAFVPSSVCTWDQAARIPHRGGRVWPWPGYFWAVSTEVTRVNGDGA